MPSPLPLLFKHHDDVLKHPAWDDVGFFLGHTRSSPFVRSNCSAPPPAPAPSQQTIRCARPSEQPVARYFAPFVRHRATRAILDTHPRPAATRPYTTATITRSKHRSHASLSGGDPSYQPLSGASSFSSQRPPIYNPDASTTPAYAPGGYHDRQRLPNRDFVTSSIGGKRRRKMYIPNTRWTWTFMGVVLVQSIASLALEIYVFGEFQASLKIGEHLPGGRPSATTTIPTYLALFIFGFIYELVLTWDALRLKNTIQVIGICLYNVGMLIYSSVQMDQVDDAVRDLAARRDIEQDTWQKLRPFLIAAPCVIALGTLTLGFVAWKLYNEFAWTIYKHISADLRLKRRYLTYQVSTVPSNTASAASDTSPRSTSPCSSLISFSSSVSQSSSSSS